MPHSRVDESSVVFNLRQLMQLEDERLVGEREAVLAARAVEEREQRERERRAHEATARAETERWAALARLQFEADTAARAETERQAELLRVRLAHEAAERRDREQLEAARRHTHTVKQRAVWVVSTAAVALVAFSLVRSPAAMPAPAARDTAVDAHYAREVASLNARIAALSALVNHTENTSETAVEPAPVMSARKPLERPKRRPLAVQNSTEKDELRDILSNDKDPIGGLQ